MTLPTWREEAIARSHDRASFDCGEAAPNLFLLRHARQNHEQNAAKTFCAIDAERPHRVLGFYTIAPSALTRGLGRYELAGFRLARLAVDLTAAGHGLGGQLLAAAALRCLRIAGEGGGLVLIIDAKSQRAAEWYASFGAESLKDRPLTLIIPLASFAPGLKAKGLL